MSRVGAVVVAAMVVVGLAGDRGAAAASRAPRCVNLVVDGDSISAGLGASDGHGPDRRLAAVLGNAVTLHNVAVSGRPVSECLRLYADLVAALFEPDCPANLIVFHAGDNDIALGGTARQAYAAFTAYVAAAHRQGWKLVASTELKRPDFSSPREAELEAYNRRLRTNVAGADAVVDFDANPLLADLSQRANPALFTRDRIHPTDGGYAVLAAMLAPAVQRVAATGHGAR